MTYANDVIGLQQSAKKRSLKRIEQHTDFELGVAIEAAYRKFGEDFYLLLHGIDAYMERRKRHDIAKIERHVRWTSKFVHEPDFEVADIWGK